LPFRRSLLRTLALSLLLALAPAGTSATQAADRFGKRFAFTVISLDPAKDSAEGWKRYLKTVGLLDADWHFLQPSPVDSEEIARRLGIKHWLQDGFVLHEVMITRVDARGRIVRRLEGYDRDTARFLRRAPRKKDGIRQTVRDRACSGQRRSTLSVPKQHPRFIGLALSGVDVRYDRSPARREGDTSPLIMA
jgi:hypothetical protein